MTPTDPRLTLVAELAKVRPPHVYHLWHAMLGWGSDFDLDAYAKFAMMDRKHVEAIIVVLTERGMMPATAKKQKRAAGSGEDRASRLPADFEMPADWIAWAREKRHWSASDTDDEAAQFTAYWQGSGGRKVDWRKTWQVWVGNSHRKNGAFSPTAETASPEMKIASMERAAETYERMGRMTEAAEMRRDVAKLRNGNVVPMRRQG